MQIISHLLILAILFNYSCTKTKIEQNPIEKNNILSKPSLGKNDEHIFRLPDVEKLADQSPILKAEGFGNENEELRFIVGDIMILSANEKLAYLNLLPKTTEDNSYTIHLIIQNLKDNSFKMAKKWIIDLNTSDKNTLTDFYAKKKKEIANIFKNESISFLNEKILFQSYDEIKNIQLKYGYQNDERKEITGITVVNTSPKFSNFQKISKKSLCPECDSLMIYKGDFLGSISLTNTKKILILGLLEQVSLSPSALHVRFVSL